MSKKRIIYSILFVTLVIVEVLIALFVDDKIIRPYVGDILVVIVLYMLVRIIIPEKCKLLPLYIFIFSVMVELLQYMKIVEILGLQNNRFMSVLMGSVFDIKDIVCYGIGCVILGGYEIILTRRQKGIRI